MTIHGKQELIDLLCKIQYDCGDNRDREGEYISDKLQEAITNAENLYINSPDTDTI